MRMLLRVRLLCVLLLLLYNHLGDLVVRVAARAEQLVLRVCVEVLHRRVTCADAAWGRENVWAKTNAGRLSRKKK